MFFVNREDSHSNSLSLQCYCSLIVCLWVAIDASSHACFGFYFNVNLPQKVNRQQIFMVLSFENKKQEWTLRGRFKTVIKLFHAEKRNHDEDWDGITKESGQ